MKVEVLPLLGVCCILVSPFILFLIGFGSAAARRLRFEKDALAAELKLTEELAAMLYGIAVKSSDADAAAHARMVTKRIGLQERIEPLADEKWKGTRLYWNQA